MKYLSFIIALVTLIVAVLSCDARSEEQDAGMNFQQDLNEQQNISFTIDSLTSLRNIHIARTPLYRFLILRITDADISIKMQFSERIGNQYVIQPNLILDALAARDTWTEIGALREQGMRLAFDLSIPGPTSLFSSMQDLTFSTNQLHESELYGVNQIMERGGSLSHVWDDFNQKYRDDVRAWEDTYELVETELGTELDSNNPWHRRLLVTSFGSRLYDADWKAMSDNDRLAVFYFTAMSRQDWGRFSEDVINRAADSILKNTSHLLSRISKDEGLYPNSDIQSMEAGILWRGFTIEDAGFLGEYRVLLRYLGQLEGDHQNSYGENRNAIRIEIDAVQSRLDTLETFDIQAPGFDDFIAISVVYNTASGRELVNSQGSTLAIADQSNRFSILLGSLTDYLLDQGVSQETVEALLSARDLTNDQQQEIIEKLGLSSTRNSTIIGDLSDGYLHDLHALIEYFELYPDESRLMLLPVYAQR